MMRRIPVFVAVLLLVIAVTTVSAQELRRTVFPQIGLGGGWSCDFFVNNQGTDPITGVKVSFWNDAGAAWVVQEATLGSKSSYTFDLAPGETKVLRISSGATTGAGYAELIGPNKNNPIRATMVVRWVSGGQVATQLGVSEQRTFSHYSFAAEVKKSAGINTALAYVNPKLDYATTLPIDLVISLVNAAGTVQATKLTTLAAGEHLSLFLDDSRLFPGLDNFVGTVSISAPDHFGLLALRLEGSALGTVSVNEGAVLAPFYLTQQATAEVEPNDATTTAFNLASLPAVVSGTISTKDDIDYFKFTAKKGDLVRVLVQLPSGSELDSEVFLLDSTSKSIAWNDQNGLGGPLSAETDLAQAGSFLTAVIPADGTYYLKLWDYWGEYGGSTYTYKMHVIVKAP